MSHARPPIFQPRQTGRRRLAWRAAAVVWLLGAGADAGADGSIDRVYHPYVEPLETELEWRLATVDDGKAERDGEQLHRFAFGTTLSERLFAEAYVLGRKTDSRSLDVSGFELEALYQLTEPGEYGADWAVLVEYERDTDLNRSGVGGGLVMEKEFGATSLAANLLAEYEYGGGIDEEFDVGAAAQWRWRWRETFEPALELYAAENTLGSGPVVTGLQRFGSRRKLRWEFGLIFGLDAETPDRTWRALLEFEF